MFNTHIPPSGNITLIDTCSLLAVPGSEIYLRNLRTSRGHITVLRAVMDELRKKTRDPDVELRNKAMKIFSEVYDYEAFGVVTIGLDEDDRNNRNFADNVFLGAVFKYGLKNNITVITQDKKLAEDLLNARNSQSVNGLKVKVMRIEEDGSLTEFMPKPEPASRTDEPPVILPSRLMKDFTQYINRTLTFTGKVIRSYPEGRGVVAEILPDDEAFSGRVRCKFTESPTQELERGQDVRISGVLVNVDPDFGEIEAADCAIQTAPSAQYQPRQFAPRRIPVPARVTQVADEKIRRTQIPEVGSRVFARDKKEYTISRIIARGRRSIVYALESDGPEKLAAKIYAPDYCTTRQLEKLRVILSMGLKYEGICFPLDILTNAKGEFSGCLMSFAEGESVEDLFCTEKVFDEKYGNWTKPDMVKMTLNVLTKIKYLHDNGVLMGNILPENILFTSPDKVSFINADSWQYKDFPCPEGDVYSTPPELQGKDFSTFLRSWGNEGFAVSVLVFRLMMQGYQPYASYERELPEEEIRAGKFPYSVGEFKQIKDYKAPSMEARRLWSHLVRQLKDSFIQAFHEEGEHSREDRRYSVGQWIRDVGYYDSCLPKMINSDPETSKIFPSDIRKALDKRHN